MAMGTIHVQVATRSCLERRLLVGRRHDRDNLLDLASKNPQVSEAVKLISAALQNRAD